MSPRLWLMFIALISLIPAQVQATGKFTFVNGQVQLVRGTQALVAEPGLAIEESDLIETKTGGYALIEFEDKLRLGIGPDTRLMLRAPNPRSKDGVRELALLGGWVKAQSALAQGVKDYRVLAPSLNLQWREASFIAHVEGGLAAFYVESGTLRTSVLDRRGRPSAPSEVRGGRFSAQGPNAAVTGHERPTESFVTAMPRPFRDPLPSLLSRFGARVIEPRIIGAVDYAEVAPWLQGPKPWRDGFIARFRPRLADAGFRQGLVSNMKAHPEWDRVLFPEKYRPRPPPTPSPPPAAVPSR